MGSSSKNADATGANVDNEINEIVGDGPPILNAQFPFGAVPHPDTQVFMSVICGNTHIRWAIHEGVKDSFYPSLFWRTSTVQENDYKERNPCKVFRRYIPDAAQETLYGKSKGELEIQDAVKLAAPRRCPMIPVYMISTNSKHEDGVRFLLHSIPNVILYRITGSDFYTVDQGAYPGIGVDRLAAAKAAVGLTGLPALVIDGGTAMTYTGVDTHNKIIGGGICPGLQVQLSSLGEYTGALPSLNHENLQAATDECKKQKKPLQLFAKNTDQAILGSVLCQFAQHLFGIIKGWQQQSKPQVEKALKKIRDATSSNINEDDDNGEDAGGTSTSASSKINKNLKVVVTGGDGSTIVDLLKKNHSNIVPVINDYWRDNTTTNKDGDDDNDNDNTNMMPTGFEVQQQKHMVHIGVQYLLCDNYDKIKNKSHDEAFRDSILGQRVAKVFHKLYRGTVAAVTRGPNIQKDLYTIIYDDSDREDVGLIELYDLLMLYHSKGEGWSERDSNRRKLLEKKVEGAKAAAEKLAENIIVVKDNLAAKRERKRRAAAAASDKRPATDGKDKSSPNKKAKTTTDDSNKKSPPATIAEAAGNKPNPAVDPQSVVGLRIGKYFQDNELYFGEIEGFYKANETDDRVDLWNVIYDDGDVEDFELGEVEQGLEIYAKHKDEDENA